jgi:hypothetical protein
MPIKPLRRSSSGWNGHWLPERTGAAWHLKILVESGEAIPGLRPAVYPLEVTADWEALLRFRHFLRHAYTVDLDAEKLSSNLARLERAAEATDPFVTALLTALEQR